MVLHMPWNRNLGGPRVQLELAEEFQALGHHIEKFDYYDAFTEAKSSRLAELTRPSFSSKAKKFVQANAHRFDIIDAHQANLPFTKEELGFKGLLIARSVGLYAFYEEFTKQEAIKYPSTKIKTQIGNWLRSWSQNRESAYHPLSFQACDLINLCNYDEFAYVRDELGLGDKCVVFPFGLSQKRKQVFAQALQPVKVRLANKQVVFIGSWCTRKGSKDWAEIIKRTKSQVPDVRFLFLGTGLSAKTVLEDINLPACDWIEIISQYDSNELPQLLSGAMIGAFPSYIEGFPFALLEKLACGLPTVAYDVPGPREMLGKLDINLMVPPGNIGQFVVQLLQMLQLNETEYSQLSQRCIDIGNKFSWRRIAEDTLNVYTKFL
jgi:glycosyltransferase involved in cell wall biosynthesis